MKIVVLVKHVPDTETRIKLAAGGKALEEGEFKYMVNPYDEFAIEEAVRTQTKNGGESVVVSMGPQRCQDALLKALAMGVDRAIWVNTENQASLDSFAVASALAKVLNEEKPDVVFTGQKAIDDDAGHVGPMVAELLGMPHVQVVTKVEWTAAGGKTARVEREVEGGMVEVYDVETPLVLGAHKSLNEPRFPSLPNIMKAKKKPLVEKKLSQLSAEAPFTEIRSYALPPEKAPGKVFKNEPVEVMVQKVVQLLRSEAKVI